MEQIGERVVDGDETLKLARLLEVLHDLFSSSGGLVGVLGLIVKPPYAAMLDARHHIAAGHGMGSELVGDHHVLGMEELSNQPPCGLGVSAALQRRNTLPQSYSDALDVQLSFTLYALSVNRRAMPWQRGTKSRISLPLENQLHQPDLS